MKKKFDEYDDFNDFNDFDEFDEFGDFDDIDDFDDDMDFKTAPESVLETIFIDNLDVRKDYIDYLQETNKIELQLYNEKNINMLMLDKEKVDSESIKIKYMAKSQLIKNIINSLENDFDKILLYLDRDTFNFALQLCKSNSLIKYEADICSVYEHKIDLFEKMNGVQNCLKDLTKLNTLKEYDLIFGNYDGNVIDVHVPKFIREKFLKYQNVSDDKLGEELIRLITGIVRTYGAININDMYDIISKFYPLEFKDLMTRVLLMEKMDMFYINLDLEGNLLYMNEISERDAMQLEKKQRQLYIYPKEFYLDYAKEYYGEAVTTSKDNEFQELAKKYMVEPKSKIYLYKKSNTYYYNIVVPYMIKLQINTRIADCWLKSEFDRRKILDVTMEEFMEICKKNKDNEPCFRKGGIIPVNNIDDKKIIKMKQQEK